MYYLVADYLVPVFIEHQGTLHISNGCSFDEKKRFYLERGLSLPRNYTIARLENRTKVRVVFFDVDNGLFLIKAPNQRIAYEVIRSLDGFFFLVVGDTPRHDRSLPKLSELYKVPQSTWTREQLLEELRQRDWQIGPTDILDFSSSRVVQEHHMRLLGPSVELIYSNPRLNESLHHLGHSRFLFYGFMVGSYYQCHYQVDRQTMSRHLMQKQYFENRERYELAFLSAFKGIERFLNVNQIKRTNIDKALVKLQMSEVRPDTKYRRWHEIFSGYPRYIQYNDLIAHFLNIRNVVAAHANPSPPSDFMISEDSLMEIQLFLSQLCGKALGEIQPRKLPIRSILSVFQEKRNT